MIQDRNQFSTPKTGRRPASRYAVNCTLRAWPRAIKKS